MSSHARSSREEQRRLSVRTLIFASIGSATAAILTSQFWIAGTPIAAALTPVIVTLVSELLNRPTERIAQRLTTQTRRLPETDALPEAAGAGPPPRDEERDPQPAREPPAAAPRPGAPGPPPPRATRAPRPGSDPEFRVYRTGTRASHLPWTTILATAAIAFGIAVAVLTLPELVAGQSLFGSGRDTTVFGGGRSDASRPPVEQQTEPQETQTTEEEEPEQPEQTAPTTPPMQDETTPAAPPPTTTPAEPRSSPPAPSAPQEP